MLTRRPTDPIRVGAGTAFFLEGTLEAGGVPVDRVSLRVGAVERPVDAHSIPAARSYGAGSAWWSLVVVEGSEPIGDVAVTLVVATGGETLELELGTIHLGTRYEGLPEPCELPAAIDPGGAGAEPLIAICMTTFDPPPDRLARQLDSIRAQTWPSWVCVISDDHSSPAGYAELERQTAGDPRFLVSRSPERLGFLRNFERAIRLAPESAGLISLADQDDRWDDDKLEVLVRALLANPGSSLAYSDVRIADSSGAILSDTYWFERRNSFASMASMMIANNVTGAASMFRRELLGPALPFPPGGTGQELYHDHWLALCALASGPLTYVDRPTHDYTRHEASVTVLETEGSWVVAASGPPRGAADALAALRPPVPAPRPWPWLALGLPRSLPADPAARDDARAADRQGCDPPPPPAGSRSPARRGALAPGRRLAAGPVLPPLGRPQRDSRPRAGGFRRHPLAEADRSLGPALDHLTRVLRGRWTRPRPDRPARPSSSQSAGSPRLADLTP